MIEEISDSKRCWVVLFGLDEARIIKAHHMEDVYSKPEAVYKVLFLDLKYRFLDIDKEADKIVESISKGPDPRLFYSADASVDKIVALPECKDKKVDKTLLEMQLEMYRSYPEHIKERHIREYDLAKKDPVALKEEIRSTLVEHANSAVVQIDGIKPTDFVSAPSSSMSMKGIRNFPNLEVAINELYSAWSALPWKQVKAIGAGYDWDAYQGVLKALQGFFDGSIGKRESFTTN